MIGVDDACVASLGQTVSVDGLWLHVAYRRLGLVWWVQKVKRKKHNKENEKIMENLRIEKV